ncbi:ARIA [Symbiodinium sp. CCMP2592]|nr:ARIA [Symbiodinium sp. CCMP2592]
MPRVCADRTFYAHRIVLAAESEVFKSGLASVSKELIDGRQEIRLAEISNPEAVKFMLDYMYQTDASVWEDYNPRTQEINKDVLRLAQTFRLPGLTERAMHWLAKDLTTGNVVEAKRCLVFTAFGRLSLEDVALVGYLVLEVKLEGLKARPLELEAAQNRNGRTKKSSALQTKTEVN